MSDDNEEYMYIVFIADTAPAQFASSTDLIDQYKKQIKDRHSNNDWWKPLDFTDEKGEVMASFPASGIRGIIRGGVVVKPDMKPTPPPRGMNQ